LEQKIRPTIQKYNTSFHILLASVYKYLLCSNEEASKQISQKLKEIHLAKTLVILNNVKTSTDNVTKNNLGKLGVLAFEIIDYDRNLAGLDVFLK
jgi:chromosome segregation ATPase